MKNNKKEEVREINVERVENIKKEKLITKDRVIAFVIGIFLGIIISELLCMCIRPHFPKEHDNQTIQFHERNRPNMPRKNDWNKYRVPNNENKNDTQISENSKDNSIQNCN